MLTYMIFSTSQSNFHSSYIMLNCAKNFSCCICVALRVNWFNLCTSWWECWLGVRPCWVLVWLASPFSQWRLAFNQQYLSDLKTEASFFFQVLRESRGSSAEEFYYFDGRSGLPTLCISAMILVALQNNSLIDVLCNRKYFLFVKLIFSVFIFP